jgi:Helix-turn-helix domain
MEALLTKRKKRRKNWSAAERWGNQDGIFAVGFLMVPMKYLSHYAELGLSNNEAMFVLQLMTFKWDANAPYPTYSTIAQRMGVSEKMARRYAKALEQKGLLLRRFQKRAANRFDLSRLFEAVARTRDSRRARAGGPRAKRASVPLE